MIFRLVISFLTAVVLFCNSVVPASTSSTTTSKSKSTSTTSHTSTASPSSTGCLKNGMLKTIGSRVSETRPASGCHVDSNTTVESVTGSSTNFRLSEIINGTKYYYSWAPEQTNCGLVGHYGYVSTDVGALATDMQWQVDCNTGKMLLIFNGTQLPSLGIELVALYKVASQTQATLDCYRKSLSLTTYPDVYFIFTDWSLDKVLQCSSELS